MVLRMYAYCGMHYDICTGDKQTLMKRAKKLIERHEKQGGSVTHLGPTEWELETPENAVMVSDQDGILKLLPDPDTD
jgi:hypothetical protein